MNQSEVFAVLPVLRNRSSGLLARYGARVFPLTRRPEEGVLCRSAPTNGRSTILDITLGSRKPGGCRFDSNFRTVSDLIRTFSGHSRMVFKR